MRFAISLLTLVIFYQTMLCTQDKSTLFILWDNYITRNAQQLEHLAEHNEKNGCIQTFWYHFTNLCTTRQWVILTFCAKRQYFVWMHKKTTRRYGKKAEPCFYHLSIPPPLELFPFYHYPHRTIRFFAKIFLADPPMILFPWQGRPRHIAKAPLAKQFLLLAVFQTFR